MKQSDKKTIVLLDAHAMLHRSFHAFPYLRTPAGQPTGAIFGMMQMILRVLSQFKPYAIYACYDLPGATFRHTAFDGYKSTRASMDDSLSIQIEQSHQMCEVMQIPIIAVPGFEADDCIGTLSAQFYADGYRVVIASGDRDTLQLVKGDDIVVWTLKSKLDESIIFNELEVFKYYGFYPETVPDYKALAGDSSDNIPGIRGIGDKTARTLCALYPHIEQLYEALEKDDETVVSVTTARVRGLISEHREEADFSRLLGTIRLDVPLTYTIPESGDSASRLQSGDIVSYCRRMAFTSLVKKVTDICGTTEPVSTLFDKLDPSNEQVDSLETIPTEKLRELQIQKWIINSNEQQPLLSEMFDWSGTSTLVDLETSLKTELEKTEQSYVWNVIEKPLIPIVSQMEISGMCLDTQMLSVIQNELLIRQSNLQKQMFELVGSEFNIHSPKQLSVVLFETLKLPIKGIKKNKSGGYSTAEPELEKLKGNHSIIELILDFRSVSKLLSTYVEALPQYLASDGRIHPHFQADGTATGRFSCSDPNIQNIPNRTVDGMRIRKAFVAEQGNMLIRFDYSQIELRLAALLANEKNMLEMFTQGRDIHTGVAMRVYGVEEQGVTKEMRRNAKIINFGILYGMGIYALANQLSVSRSEAQDFMDAYTVQFPQLAGYFALSIDQARKNGFCQTLFGRRRYIPELDSTNAALRAYGERIAMNAPVQGTAADVMKLGMIECAQVMKQFEGIKMIAQVHDEVLFEVPVSMDIDAIAMQLKSALEQVLIVYKPDLSPTVPINVECEIGPSWGSMERKLLKP